MNKLFNKILDRLEKPIWLLVRILIFVVMPILIVIEIVLFIR
jgi:hypothetical protein